MKAFKIFITNFTQLYISKQTDLVCLDMSLLLVQTAAAARLIKVCPEELIHPLLFYNIILNVWILGPLEITENQKVKV